MKKINQNVIIGVIVYAFFLFFIRLAIELPNESRTMPMMILVLIAVLNTIIFADGIKRTIKQDNSGQNKLSLRILKGPALTALLMIGYAALFKLIGYYLATPILFVAMLLVYHYRNVKKIVIITAGFEAFAYLLFYVILSIRLP